MSRTFDERAVLDAAECLDRYAHEDHRDPADLARTKAFVCEHNAAAYREAGPLGLRFAADFAERSALWRRRAERIEEQRRDAAEARRG